MPTLFITGANRGLGLELTRQYLADGWSVHCTARNPDSATELKALSGDLTVHRLDVADFAATRALAQSLEGLAIDLLWANAGIIDWSEKFGSLDYEHFERSLRINTVAPFVLAESFLGHVMAGERKMMVAMSSILGSIGNNDLGGFISYRTSKAGLNGGWHSLALSLKRDYGITAICAHPGWVRTDMGTEQADLDPEPAMRGLRETLAKLTPDNAGQFWAYDGTEVPW